MFSLFVQWNFQDAKLNFWVTIDNNKNQEKKILRLETSIDYYYYVLSFDSLTPVTIHFQNIR